MAAQDDVRENRMLDLFNLRQPSDRVRHGTDAILDVEGHTLEFELKSVTTGTGKGLTTVRDFGPDHIAKWKDKHWLVSVFTGTKLMYSKYGSPAAMAPWIESKWAYIEQDFRLAEHLPNLVQLETMHAILGAKPIYSLSDAKRLHKNQYSKEQYLDLMDVRMSGRVRDKPTGYSPERMLAILQDRTKYVLLRGSTLNNPHIPAKYFGSWETITDNPAFRLRQLVRQWLNSNRPQAHVPLEEQPGNP